LRDELVQQVEGMSLPKRFRRMTGEAWRVEDDDTLVRLVAGVVEVALRSNSRFSQNSGIFSMMIARAS